MRVQYRQLGPGLVQQGNLKSNYLNHWVYLYLLWQVDKREAFGNSQSSLSTDQYLYLVQSPCSKCEGQGTVIPDKDKCKGCGGSKIKTEKKEIEIQVAKGMTHGTKITLQGMGDEEVLFCAQFIIHNCHFNNNLTLNLWFLVFLAWCFNGRLDLRRSANPSQPLWT